MSSWLRAFLVVVLCLSGTGTLELFAAEPCGIGAAQADNDDACPPTCHQCQCCFHAAAIIGDVALGMALNPIEFGASLPAEPPTSASREVLHVPKPLL